MRGIGQELFNTSKGLLMIYSSPYHYEMHRLVGCDNQETVWLIPFFFGPSCAYQPEQRKHPLHVLLEVGHVGRTSFSVITTVKLPSGDVMLTAVNQVRLLILKLAPR